MTYKPGYALLKADKEIARLTPKEVLAEYGCWACGECDLTILDPEGDIVTPDGSRQAVASAGWRRF